MKKSQKNIASLPAECWGVLSIDNSIINIKSGEPGYYKFLQPTWMLKAKQREILNKTNVFPTRKELANSFVDELNESLGVTRAQRTAMEFGAQFGWDVQAADPKHWEEIENFLKNKNFNLN